MDSSQGYICLGSIPNVISDNERKCKQGQLENVLITYGIHLLKRLCWQLVQDWWAAKRERESVFFNVPVTERTSAGGCEGEDLSYCV